MQHDKRSVPLMKSGAPFSFCGCAHVSKRCPATVFPNKRHFATVSILPMTRIALSLCSPSHEASCNYTLQECLSPFPRGAPTTVSPQKRRLITPTHYKRRPRSVPLIKSDALPLLPLSRSADVPTFPRGALRLCPFPHNKNCPATVLPLPRGIL